MRTRISKKYIMKRNEKNICSKVRLLRKEKSRPAVYIRASERKRETEKEEKKSIGRMKWHKIERRILLRIHKSNQSN